MQICIFTNIVHTHYTHTCTRSQTCTYTVPKRVVHAVMHYFASGSKISSYYFHFRSFISEKNALSHLGCFIKFG